MIRSIEYGASACDLVPRLDTSRGLAQIRGLSDAAVPNAFHN